MLFWRFFVRYSGLSFQPSRAESAHLTSNLRLFFGKTNFFDFFFTGGSDDHAFSVKLLRSVFGANMGEKPLNCVDLLRSIDEHW